jgi:hypothetical protein
MQERRACACSPQLEAGSTGVYAVLAVIARDHPAYWQPTPVMSSFTARPVPEAKS